MFNTKIVNAKNAEDLARSLHTRAMKVHSNGDAGNGSYSSVKSAPALQTDVDEFCKINGQTALRAVGVAVNGKLRSEKEARLLLCSDEGHIFVLQTVQSNSGGFSWKLSPFSEFVARTPMEEGIMKKSG